tara:strand:+ start:41 stop:571 length:531 start_codon:yes stop_codon:yes gene_type:complete
MGIFDIFKSKKIKGSSNKTKISSNKPVLPDLANDIHKKFHLTCDVLEKIKPNTNCVDLIKQLNLAGVSEEKYSNNTFEIDLDIGNGWIFSKIQNANHSMSNFQKYNFSITGIQDYSGLYLSFTYEDKKREINLVDHQELWGKMSNPANQASLDQMRIRTEGKQLYELILAKGKFKK